jgi:hypothetical protein
MLAQFFAGYEFARMFKEECKNLQRLISEMNPGSVLADLARIKINLECAKPNRASDARHGPFPCFTELPMREILPCLVRRGNRNFSVTLLPV